MGFLFMALGIVAILVLIWLWGIAPQLQERPSFEEFDRYDYAHRGLHNNKKAVPENSLKSFKLAVQSGFGIELDLQLSKDGYVVVHHDADLKRTCGENKKVMDLTLQEIRTRSLLQTDEKIPTFAEALALVDGMIPLIIELKTYNDVDTLCTAVWDILKHYNGLYCVESFDPRIVRWFRKNQPHVVRGQLMSFMKKGDYGFSSFTAFLARNLMTNWITRPNFEAYDFTSRKNLSLQVARRVFAMKEASWTLRNTLDYAVAKGENCLCIFENFEPTVDIPKMEFSKAQKSPKAAVTTSTRQNIVK